ncbi:MAG: efflux RND transporter periplasmic adaptor subunit [Nitrospirota bacterium]|nr:efflux RND transporter periplasmic adaptor subunit [Nitrospirota bacterium]
MTTEIYFIGRVTRAAAVLLVSAAMAGLVGCKQEAASTPARPLPEVEVLTVTAQTVPDEPELIGQAESSRPVEIRSQVTGIIKERYFTEGRDVKRGDRLYQIDPVPFQAAVASAKGKVAQAAARVVQARQNLARVKPLLEEQAVSQKDVDDAVAEDLSSKASLESAKAELIKAEFDMSNTLITAPIDGLIERTKVYEGRLVSAQTDLLTVIHQMDPMYVIVSAPENFLLKRRRERASKKVQGAEVYDLRGVITFTDGSTYPHEGDLDLLDVGLRTTTGTMDVRVVFPNPERALLPGQFVTVRFLGAVRTGAILVPQRAVQQGAKGPVVYVVGEGDKVEVRDILAAAWHGNQWLVEEGLKAGERIVVEGMYRVAPGAPVKPVPYQGPAASSGTQAPQAKGDAKPAAKPEPGPKPEAGK